ncbi:RteC domain-containing protein [Mucilaginibacter sp. HD30]
MSDLKGLVVDKGFTSEKEEIYFFKHIKPRVYAHQIYEVLLFHLRQHTPAGPAEMIKSYYEDELKQVFRFFRIESFAYEYFKNVATELDHAYFVRDQSRIETPLLDLVDPSPGFSTAWDYKFAKFIAYERLQELLIEHLTDFTGCLEKANVRPGKRPCYEMDRRYHQPGGDSIRDLANRSN